MSTEQETSVTAILTNPPADKVAYQAGVTQASWNAAGLGIPDYFRSDPYYYSDNPASQRSYLQGRLSGDLFVIGLGVIQIHGGGGAVTGSPSAGILAPVVAGVGGVVALHGATEAAVAIDDITNVLSLMNKDDNPYGNKNNSSTEEINKRQDEGIESIDKAIKAGKVEAKGKYENPGHHDPSNNGSNKYNSSKSILPGNHKALWEQSVKAKDGNRWTKIGSEKKAEYHRFQSDGNGNWHWNGSTVGKTKSGESRAISPNNIPKEIKSL